MPPAASRSPCMVRACKEVVALQKQNPDGIISAYDVGVLSWRPDCKVKAAQSGRQTVKDCSTYQARACQLYNSLFAFPIMASILPPIPRFVFTIFEPLSLVAGVFAAVLDTENFVKGQLPSASATPVWPAASTQVLALQLGNLYGLLGMVGIGVLYFTSEARVVRNYLLACAIADVGHVWATYAVMGQKDFLDVTNWNAMAWGNIGVTVGLLITRVLYLTGILGEDKIVESTKQAVKKRS